MATNPEVTYSPIVPELYRLDAEIAALQEQKKRLEAELIEEGDGTYCELDGRRTAIVVSPAAPKPTYTLYPAAAKKAFLEDKGEKKSTPELDKEFAAAQEQMALGLAGEHFKTLFDRVVEYRPAKGFGDMVARLMKGKTATAARLLRNCIVAKAAGETYVKLPDRPKPEKPAAEE